MNRAKTSSSSSWPVATMELRARSTSCSIVQSSNATPTIGQSSRPRSSSRYSDRKVITRARSPVMPKTTSTSAGADARSGASDAVAAVGVVIVSSMVRRAWLDHPSNGRRGVLPPHWMKLAPPTLRTGG